MVTANVRRGNDRDGTKTHRNTAPKAARVTAIRLAFIAHPLFRLAVSRDCAPIGSEVSRACVLVGHDDLTIATS